jgi:hypothetical protein
MSQQIKIRSQPPNLILAGLSSLVCQKISPKCLINSPSYSRLRHSSLMERDLGLSPCLWSPIDFLLGALIRRWGVAPMTWGWFQIAFHFSNLHFTRLKWWNVSFVSIDLTPWRKEFGSVEVSQDLGDQNQTMSHIITLNVTWSFPLPGTTVKGQRRWHRTFVFLVGKFMRSEFNEISLSRRVAVFGRQFFWLWVWTSLHIFIIPRLVF